MYEEMFNRLDLLKRALHPEMQINIITQCETVLKAFSYGSPFERDLTGIATYLEISTSQASKMKTIAERMISVVKEWFRDNEYQIHAAYDVAVLPESTQRAWLQKLLEEDVVSGDGFNMKEFTRRFS